MNTRKIMDNARAALADTRTPADVAVDGAIEKLGNAAGEGWKMRRATGDGWNEAPIEADAAIAKAGGAK